MSLIKRVFAQTGDPISIPVKDSVQHFIIKRTAALGILSLGLALGLPETVNAEVLNSGRKRAELLDRIPLSHIAAWGQYGRSPIVENVILNVQQPTDELPAGLRIETTALYYVGQRGPLEIADADRFTLEIDPVPGAIYEVYAPEVPMNVQAASEYYLYERGIILESTLKEPIALFGYCGIVLPNTPAAYERFVLEFQVTDTETTTKEYTLSELLDMQQERNPFVSVATIKGATRLDDRSVLHESGRCDLLVLDLKFIRSIEVHSVGGQKIEYTKIKVQDRNTLV